MFRSSVGSILSTFVTACFALSVLTRAAMPGCITAPESGAGVHAPAAHHDHQHDGGHSSGKQSQCPMHLCCANASAPPVALVSATAFFPALQSSGFVALLSILDDRPAHFLPFAHGPPLTSL